MARRTGTTGKVSARAAKRRDRVLKSMEKAAVKESSLNVNTLANVGLNVGGELGGRIAKRGPATRAFMNVRGGEQLTKAQKAKLKRKKPKVR